MDDDIDEEEELKLYKIVESCLCRGSSISLLILRDLSAYVVLSACNNTINGYYLVRCFFSRVPDFHIR